MRWRKSADWITLTISALSFASTSFGVATGASTPNHVPASKSLSPDSASVGTSGKRGGALAGRDGERAQLAALDVRQHRRDRVERHLHLAAEQVGRQRPAALVGDVEERHPGERLELRADQVLGGAVAVGAERVRVRRCLAEGDEALHVGRGRAGVDHEHVGDERHRRDRRQVLLEVVRQLLVDAGGDRVMHGADQQRVAVRLRLRDVVGAERCARARLAFDDHRLAEGRAAACRPARERARRWFLPAGRERPA